MPQLPDELRHAYRALLRAVTYLPDSTARAYIHNYTVSRFRDAANKILSAKGPSAETLIARYHSRDKIRKVWQACRKLERAGQGSAVDLEKVLFLTYGRSGRRRRELVQRLLNRDENEVPTDEKALEELIQKHSHNDDTELRSHKDNPQLKALIQSQQGHQLLGIRTMKRRNLAADIPKTNIWGRTTPLKLQASIKQRYWAETLEKLLPPLPRYEWDRLRNLATGIAPIEKAPSRRARLPQAPSDASILDYFTIPTNRQTSEIEKIDIGEDFISTSLEKGVPAKGIHNMRPRFMRRLYALIWSMTPTMSQDDSTTEWTTTWGGARSAVYSGQVTAPSVVDIELFEGSDGQAKPGTAASVEEKGVRRRIRHRRRNPRHDGKVSLGNAGYPQGVTPAI